MEISIKNLTKITGSDIIEESNGIYKSTLYFRSTSQFNLFIDSLNEERIKELIKTNRLCGEYNFDYILYINNLTRFSTINLDNCIINIKNYTCKEKNAIEIFFEFIINDSNKEIIEKIKKDLSKFYLFPRCIMMDNIDRSKLRLVTIDLLKKED